MDEEGYLSQSFLNGDLSEEQLFELYQTHPELFESLLQKQYADMQQNFSVYNECVVPVLTQSYETMGNLLIFCLMLRILSLSRIPQPIFNLVSFGLGCLSLWQFYQHSMFFVVMPLLILVFLHQFSNVHKGMHVGICVVYIVTCEMFLNAVTWNKIKGSVMILFMKILSLVLDEEKLTLIDLCGYLFNPASVIFGPFLTYKDYNQLFSPQSLTVTWFLRVIICVTASSGCLVWSSCGIPYYMNPVTNYLPIQDDNKWWIAYKDAQSFRFSHYFVSYFTELCCITMGVGSFARNEQKSLKDLSNQNTQEADDNKKQTKSSSDTEEFIWRKPVANLLPVEVPRSLVDVVTNWNLPMHFWLKQYVFKNTRRYGIFVAIFFTYVASSILHGLNFQLSAVLLSIGVFAYVEAVFRSALASTFSACIEARPCKENCNHKYKKWNVLVSSMNLLFSFLAVWNLMYLGCVFDASEGQETGYSMNHTLGKWKNYQYANHLFMFTCFILQRLILSGRVF